MLCKCLSHEFHGAKNVYFQIIFIVVFSLAYHLKGYKTMHGDHLLCGVTFLWSLRKSRRLLLQLIRIGCLIHHIYMIHTCHIYLYEIQGRCNNFCAPSASVCLLFFSLPSVAFTLLEYSHQISLRGLV